MINLSAWFHTWRLRRQATRLLQASRDIKTVHTQRFICEKLLAMLDPQRFARYRADIGAGVRIHVFARNVEQYADLLRRASAEVIKEAPMNPASWGSYAGESNIPVDRFLVSSDGYYIDYPKAIAAFRNAGLQLCQALEPSDEAEYGVYEHNLRVLTKLLQNLREVTAALLDVSLQH